MAWHVIARLKPMVETLYETEMNMEGTQLLTYGRNLICDGNEYGGS